MNLLRQLIVGFGGQRAFARTLGVTNPAIGKWLRPGPKGGARVPAERCLDVERILGVPQLRYRLRPDVYGPAEADRPAERAIQRQAA